MTGLTYTRNPSQFGDSEPYRKERMRLITRWPELIRRADLLTIPEDVTY